MNSKNTFLRAAFFFGLFLFTFETVGTVRAEQFIAGADFSHVAWIESTGASYKIDGKKADPFEILKQQGINYIRLRQFTSSDKEASADPYNRINNLKYNVPIARRIKKAGMKFLLDFHYSDSWADPGQQNKPKAWDGLSYEELKKTLFEYNRDCVLAFKKAGAMPDMIQIGNETTPGMVWPEGRNNSEEQWKRYAELIKVSIDGVREAVGDSPMPQIMIHIDRGGDWGTSKWFFDNLAKYDVEFDIIGQSYYPFWHGTFDDLKKCLNGCAERYKKPVVVCETAFPWIEKHWDGKPIDAINDIVPGKEGQVRFVKELGKILDEVPDGRGIGLFWWAAEYLPVKNVNMAGFETRSFFDRDGNALPVIDAIGRLAQESAVAKKPGTPMRSAPALASPYAAVRAQADEAPSGETVIIPNGHDKTVYWRYTFQLQDGEADRWMKKEFDDSKWSIDEGCFGNSCNNRGVTIPQVDGEGIIYLRRSFDLKNATKEQIDSLRFRMEYDEDPILYINGVEALSLKGHRGRSDHPISEAAKKAIDPNGRNLVAVVCPNKVGGHHIDVGLVASTSMTLPPQPTVIADKWVPKPSRLMTTWAEKIDPQNVLQEYPRPQLVRKDWLNLNGVWDFAKSREGETTFPADAATLKILVPFPYTSPLSGVMKNSVKYEHVVYRRSFEIPTDWNGRNVLLNFGGVMWEAEAFVNGEPVGKHQGGFAPFSFDITKALKPGKNELIVKVYDPSKNGGVPVGKQRHHIGGIFYTPGSGIWQTVWLEPAAKNHVESVRYSPVVEDGKTGFQINVHAKNDGTDVTGTVYDGKTKVADFRGKTGREIEVLIPGAKLWSVESPFLYDIKFDLLESGKKIDSVESYYGIRKFEMKKVGDWFRPFLNGKEVFLFGPLDQGYWPCGVFTAPSDEALRWDIEKMKEFGCNTIRKHMKVESARWFYWCDKLGILVLQDMPSAFNDQNQPKPLDYGNFEREMVEIIGSLANYPSYVNFCVFNEGWGQPDEKETIRLTKVAEKLVHPERLVTSASGWVDYKAGDICDNHAYPGPWSNADPARLNIGGEFGGTSFVIEGHTWKGKPGFDPYESTEDREKLNKAFETQCGYARNIYHSRGMSGAIYTQLSDVEDELNGFFTYDRKINKFDPKRVKKAIESIFSVIGTPPPEEPKKN